MGQYNTAVQEHILIHLSITHKNEVILTVIKELDVINAVSSILNIRLKKVSHFHSASFKKLA